VAGHILTEKKILYLVRHAKSSWKDSSLADRDRPLNKRGRRSAPAMGRRMLEQGHLPDLIVCSPANRALSTAKKIALELGCDVSAIVTDGNLYFSGTPGMRSVLEALDDRYQRVMMVGHNPTMTNLMNILGNTFVVNMPTCAIAVIGFDVASWADVYSADGKLLGYDFPKGSGSFTAGVLIGKGRAASD
jgi:phosphohistidine phosphatase